MVWSFVVVVVVVAPFLEMPLSAIATSLVGHLTTVLYVQYIHTVL